MTELLVQPLVVGARQAEARQGEEARAASPRRPMRRGRQARRHPERVHNRWAERAVDRRHHRAPHRRRQALCRRIQGRLLQPDRGLLHRLADEVPIGRRGAQHAVARRGDVVGCIVHTDRRSGSGSVCSSAARDPWSAFHRATPRRLPRPLRDRHRSGRTGRRERACRARRRAVEPARCSPRSRVPGRGWSRPARPARA